MKVWIDQDLCTGDGLCEEIAPAVFTLLDDGLAYVGKVGTGFTDELLEDLGRRLRPLVRPNVPFVGALPRAQVAGATWVRPALVGEVQFSEWTGDGRLRHPSWRGLRPDKKPDEVRVED